jgi:hypothetical protein
MEIRLPARAVLFKENCIALKAVDRKDEQLVLQLFSKKDEWEKRNGREFFLQAALTLKTQERTYKQNRTVWKLVTVIFESMEGRKPTEEEKHDLYLDLLEVYADKKPNRLGGGLRPVHISEANSVEGARFVDGLLHHLSSVCELDYDAQSAVIDVLQEWAAWRGGLAVDPCDFSDAECRCLLTEGRWRELHIYSEASGRGGDIERAHIVSRGADGADIEMAWNWLALTGEEHRLQHQRGWDYFLRVYPHLRGRVERARKLAGEKELPTLIGG